MKLYICDYIEFESERFRSVYINVPDSIAVDEQKLATQIPILLRRQRHRVQRIVKYYEFVTREESPHENA